MINRIKSFKIPLILTLGLFVVHLIQKDFSDPYQRTITGDAQAYYAYLPALFIYQDLGYSFIDDVNAKYYPPEHQKDFVKPAGDGVVNKTFPGVAILYLPFFLIAHFLASIFSDSPDGFSTIYQVLFDVGLWTYLFFGLLFLSKILRMLQFSKKIVALTLTAIAIGTNVYFYSVYDQSVTHIYNFFLINAVIYCLFRFQQSQSFKWLGFTFLILAILAITRPTNVLVMGLIFFFFPNRKFYWDVWNVLKQLKNGGKILLIVLPIFAIPFILWKAQTNNWIVYSYGDEKFDFTQPHFFEFLFSYFKGWFVYTPIALIAILVGGYLLLKKDLTKFWIAILFYGLTTYIFSSWWCWYYGAGMSQRVMIDHYILLAVLLALCFQKMAELKWLKFVLMPIFIGVVGLNVVQAYQIRFGILEGGFATKEKYWDNFLVLEKRARVYPLDHWQLITKQPVSLNPIDGNLVKGQAKLIENEFTIEVNAIEDYSASLQLNNVEIPTKHCLKLTFYARARTDCKTSRMVLTSNDQQTVFGLDQYMKQDEWVKIEWLFEPGMDVDSTPIIYFWNAGSGEKIEFKSFGIELFYVESYI